MMNQQSVSRDMKFLQNAAETISSFNSSTAANAPVQEGDVSSSNRPILTTESFGPELQNLQGFLFVVNCQGKIVSVTDNITQFLGYQPSEWPNASIYDFLHVTNHASFGQILSLLGDGRSVVDPNKFVPPLPCRMRHGSSNADGSDRRRDEETLVHLQISSLPYRIKRLSSQTSPSSGSQMYLICVAQKVDDPLALYSRSQLRVGRKMMQHLLPSPHAVTSTKSSARVDFTMHLTSDWTIHACDFSVLGQGADFCNRFIGNKFTMFVHNNDLQYIQKYADSVCKGGAEEFSSNIYRFKLTDTRYVYIHSKSQLAPASGADGGSLIFSKHSIVRECHANELKGSASSSLMKAIIQSKPQTLSTTQDGLNIVTNTSLGPEQTPYNFRHNGVQSTGNISGSRPYQLTGSDQLSGGTMMSGFPQAPDLNFNDVYSSRLPSSGVDFDVFETDWGSTTPTQLTQTQGMTTQSLGGQLPVHILQPDISSMQRVNQASRYDNKTTPQELPPLYSNSHYPLPQPGSNGRLRDLLSSITSPTDITTGEAIAISLGDQVTSKSGRVLHKLLQAEDDATFLNLSSLYTSTQQNGCGAGNSSIYSHAESRPTPPMPTMAGGTKGLEQHQLLKKLLTSDEPSTEDGEKSEQNGILQKLLKDEDEEKQTCSTQKKSPAEPSPSDSSSSPTRRHNSGGSNKEGKSRHKEESGRGTKRKISNVSTIITATTTAITEPDSTAPSTNNTLLNQLLIKPLDTVNKVDPQEVTATPLERIKAQRNTRHNSNVIDVVNDRIMIGAEQIDMKRLTSMVRSSDANNATSLYARQGSAGYPNGALMVNQQRHAMDTGPLPHHPDMLMTQTYNLNGSKDFSNAPDGLLSSPVFSQPTSRNTALPSNFPQAIDGDGGSSMLQQLFNPDTDNLIIQELESLLGGDTSMQLTSPEDELAIKDIEKQLLYGTESLCPNKAFSGSTTEPHSPGFPMGLTDLPASASNPVHATAIYNIHHKPQISQNTPGYGAQAPHNSPQLAHALSDQQGLSRGSSLAAIRANHRTMSRQGSGLVRSADGKMRRSSGNSPSVSMSSFSPMGGPINQPAQGNFVIPSNFGEIMKSNEPPPNVRLPQDMNSSSFPARGAHMLRRELNSPHTSRASQSFAASPMDVTTPVSQHFHHGGDQYGPNVRSNVERQMMGGPAFHGDQLGVSPNHPSIDNNNIKSPQGVRSGQPSPAQSKHQQYNHIDQISSNAVSSSAFVKQEMKAKIAARAQKQITSPQHQNFVSQQHAMTSQQMSIMSPPTSHQTSMSAADPFGTHMAATSMRSDLSPQDNYQDSVLPDDILNQITELTATQNEMQQHQIGAIANSTPFPVENSRMSTDHDIVRQKINQSKKDSSVVREQLRALADRGGVTSQSDNTLEKVFRTQLAKSQTSKPKTGVKTSSDAVEFHKLMQPAQNPVSIITVEPRPPVKELQPTDQRNSLLQQLLTDSVSS